MKSMTRPNLIRILFIRSPTIRTFSFAPKFFAGETGDTWTRTHVDEEMQARKKERDRLLALKRRLKARMDHLDEMDNHFADEIRNAWSENERSRLKECWKSLEGMREAQNELEKHVDGIIEDTIEEERSDPRSYIIGVPTSASSTGPHHGAATTDPQAGHVNVTSDYHSTKSDSY